MKKQQEEQIGIRVDKDLKDKYQKYCEEYGFSLSKRLKMFMKKDLEGKLEIKRN